MSDVTDRARELREKLSGLELWGDPGNQCLNVITSALQRERDEAEARAVAWYCEDVPEDELDSFGIAALSSLRAAIRGEKT